MTGRRSTRSAAKAANQALQNRGETATAAPAAAAAAGGGTKRKASGSTAQPAASKRGKKAATPAEGEDEATATEPKQQSLEQVLDKHANGNNDNVNGNDNDNADVEMGDAPQAADNDAKEARTEAATANGDQKVAEKAEDAAGTVQEKAGPAVEKQEEPKQVEIPQEKGKVEPEQASKTDEAAKPQEAATGDETKAGSSNAHFSKPEPQQQQLPQDYQSNGIKHQQQSPPAQANDAQAQATAKPEIKPQGTEQTPKANGHHEGANGSGDKSEPPKAEAAQEQKVETSAPPAKKPSATNANGNHEQKTDDKPANGGDSNGFDNLMSDKKDEPVPIPEASGSNVPAKEGAVEKSPERAEVEPHSILEKGMIYFFFRGRVGIPEPSDVSEIARSYIVLRPLPPGGKLTGGPIGDAGNNRLLALPKKVLPKGPQDRFMTFVEKAKCSMDYIKDQFSGSNYTTQTAGARHTPSATPIGEGVYAITQTGRETHLAYVLTLPSPLGEVQRSIGLDASGSFVTSAKNPKSSGPASAQLPQGAEFPQGIFDEFGGRGWMPLQPKMLEYDNCQFLLIGHKADALEKAAPSSNTDQTGSNGSETTEAPHETVEKLQQEDEQRVAGLGPDHAVFRDLGLSSKEFSTMQSTW